MTTEETKTGVFENLSGINVKDRLRYIKTGKVNLAYMSWSDAWSLLLSKYPEATQRTREYPSNEHAHVMLPYLETNTGYYVTVVVTVNGLERSETLPVLDNKNQTIMKPNNAQINKAIKRCLTKAIASHGLGLYIYQGEDLPVGEEKFTSADKEYWDHCYEQDALAFAAMSRYETEVFNAVLEKYKDIAAKNRKITEYKAQVKARINEGFDLAVKTADVIINAINNDAPGIVAEEMEGLEDDSRRLVGENVPEEMKPEILKILREAQ